MTEDKQSSEAVGPRLDRGVGRPVPKGALWTRHFSGREEWWTHGDYLARQAGGDGRWVLRYRGGTQRRWSNKTQAVAGLLVFESEETMEWQPIETVPKETEVLVWFGPGVGVKSATYTDKDGDGIWFWCVTDGKFDPHPVRRYCLPYPTHWAPLPPGPDA